MCGLKGGLLYLRLLFCCWTAPILTLVTLQTLHYHCCSMSSFSPCLFFKAHLLKLSRKLSFSHEMVVHGSKPGLTFLGSTAAGLVRREWGNIISSTGQ